MHKSNKIKHENGEKSKVIDKENINPKLISSSKISLLLGSGVNGSLFPQLSGFTNTIEKLKEVLMVENIETSKMEELISSIKDLDKRKDVLDVFKDEIRKFAKDINYENKSRKNIENMLISLDRLIQFEENRTCKTKQVNIFTLNYDEIFEHILDEVGLFYNILSPRNVKKKSYLYSLVGHDFLMKNYKTTFLISKLHGDINEPILPGLAKFDELLAEKYFELLFNMKVVLREPNSVLFIIGYSGNDEHINQLIVDCFDSGLTVYWIRYDPTSSIPDELKKKVIIIDQKSTSYKDSTEILYLELWEIWENR